MVLKPDSRLLVILTAQQMRSLFPVYAFAELFFD
jgi:hypothetical protein